METGAGNKEFTLVEDPDLSDSYFQNCTLTLVLGHGLLLFGIINSDTNVAVSFGSSDYADGELSNVLKHPVFDRDYHKIICSVHSRKFTLVPKELDNLSNSLDSIRSFFMDDAEPVEISGLQANLMCSKNNDLKYIFSKYPNCELKSANALFLENVIQKNRYQKGIRIYVEVLPDSIHMIKTSDDSLISYSSENTKSEEDKIYFLSSHIAICGFSQLEDRLYLSGALERDSQFYKYCTGHVKNVVLNLGLSYQKVSANLKGLQKHHFFQVINTYQCA